MQRPLTQTQQEAGLEAEDDHPAGGRGKLFNGRARL